MIHHTCTQGDGDNMTAVGMDYAGQYRCLACKRRVDMSVDSETWGQDLKAAPRIEPPHPEGMCK